MAAPLDAFKGATTATDAQKAALSSMIAAQGSAGAESFKAEQAVQAAAAQNARDNMIASNPGIGQPNMSSAVGPGELTQMLAARAAAPGQLGAAQMGQAGAEFNKYAGLIGNANASYMDAVKGAVPIVQSQTAAQVAQINADLAAKRQARQQELDDAATQRDHDAELWHEHIVDRMLDEADRKAKGAAADAQPYQATQAASSLGWDSKKTSTVLNNPAYQTLYQYGLEQLKTLGPNADPQQLAGLLAVRMSTPDQAGHILGPHPEAARLVLSQLGGLLGRPMMSAPPPNNSGNNNGRSKPPARKPNGDPLHDFGGTRGNVGVTKDSPTPHYNALTLTTMSEQSLKRLIRTSGAKSPDGKRAQAELDRRAKGKPTP